MKTKDLIKNTLILGIGMVLPKIINILTLPIYTKYVDTSDYGSLTYLTTVILSLIVPVITLQLENAVFRYLIDTDQFEDHAQYISSSFAVVTLMTIPTMAVMYFVSIKPFTAWYYHFIISLYVGVQTYVLYFRQIARGFGDNTAYSTSAVISVVGNFLAMVVTMIILKWSSLGYFLSLLLADVFSIIYLLLRLNYFKYIRVKYFDLVKLKAMLKYALPLIPNTISWFIINFFDQTIVVFLLGSGPNGILSTAHKIPNMFNTFYQAFNLAWTEHSARNVEEKGMDRYNSSMFDAMYRVLCGCALCLIAFSPLVFKILVRSKAYYEAMNHMPLLILATFLSCLASFYGSIYVAQKQSEKVGKSSVLAAVINIAVHVLTIGTIKLYAAGLSSVVAFLAITIYRAVDINKNVYKIRYNKRLIGISIVFFAICIALFYINNVFVMIFNMAFALFILYFLNMDMIAMVLDMVKRKLQA